MHSFVCVQVATKNIVLDICSGLKRKEHAIADLLGTMDAELFTNALTLQNNALSTVNVYSGVPLMYPP